MSESTQPLQDHVPHDEVPNLHDLPEGSLEQQLLEQRVQALKSLPQEELRRKIFGKDDQP
jgi:hypothetical protein